MRISSSTQPSIRWAFNFRDWKPTREEWIFASRCIQAEEKERIGRFVFAKDSKASMIGRLLLRKAACEVFGMHYEEVELGRSEKGKPYLLNIPKEEHIDYDFNVSHQGNYCVLAGEPCPELGVDIMKIEYTGGRSTADFFNLMKRQFSSSEWRFIKSPNHELNQLSRFFRLWTLKESYVKAVGTGISVDLQQLSFHCPTVLLQKGVVTLDSTLYMNEEPLTDWRFQETLLDEEHCISVAVKQTDTVNSKDFSSCSTGQHPMFNVLTFQDLIKSAHPSFPPDEAYWTSFSRKPEDPCDDSCR